MKLAVLSVMCAIIGAAAGYLATPSGDTTPELPNRESAGSDASAQELRSNVDSSTPTKDRTGATSASVESIVSAEGVSTLPSGVVSELIAEAGAGIAVEGEGIIRGKVADRFGRPLDGVLVSLQLPTPTVIDRWPLSIANGQPVTTELIDVVRSTIREHTRERLLRRETRTDAGGEFMLSGLPDQRTLTLAIFKEGWLFSCGWSRLPMSIESGALLYVTGAPLTNVTMSVVDEKDAEVDGAWINATRVNSQSLPRFWWSPANRDVSLEDGAIQVSATLDEEDSESAEPITIDVPLKEDVQLPVKLTIKKASTLEVSVIFPTGERGNGFLVKLVPIKSQSVTEEEITNAAQGRWVEPSNRRCKFPNVASGSYVVAAMRDNEIVVRKNVDVADGATKTELEIPAAKASDYVIVRVFDPEGDVLRDVTVYDSENGGSVIGRTDGSFWVSRKPGADDGDGNMEPKSESRLTANSAQYGLKTVKYSPASSTEVVIKFEPASTLTITVDDYIGRSLDGRLLISLQSETKDRNATNEEFTAHADSGRDISTADDKARGVFKFRSLQVGPHVAVVSANNLRGDQQHLMRHAFVVKPGENDVRIKLPTLYTLTVQTVGLKTGTGVNVNRQVVTKPGDDEPEEGMWANANTDEQGIATFDHLTPGSYAISTYLEDGEAGTIFVEVPRQTNVRYDARPANALMIPLNAEPKKLEELGFRTGDVIVGFEGQEWEGGPSSAIDGIDTELESVAINIIRGGSRIEISVDPKKFNEARGEIWLMPVVR